MSGTQSRARIRRLAAENEQLKLQLTRCSCGRGRSRSAHPYSTRLEELLDENERLRSIVDRLECEKTKSPALLTEAFGVVDVIRRYRRVLRAAILRINDLETTIEKQSAHRHEETTAEVLKQAVECLQSAKQLNERSLALDTARQAEAAVGHTGNIEPTSKAQEQSDPAPGRSASLRSVCGSVTSRSHHFCRSEQNASSQEIGTLDTEIMMLRAALRDSQKKRNRRHTTDSARKTTIAGEDFHTERKESAAQEHS